MYIAGGYEFHSHRFSHAVRPCKPPVLLHGKVTDQHRETPYRAAQRLSAWVANRHQVQLLRSIRETKTAYLFRRVPLKKTEVYFFVLPLWTDARNLVPVSRTRCGISFLPFARVSRFATPFCTTPFQGVRQSYALKAGVGNHDTIQNAVACKSEQSKNFAAVRHNAHKPRRVALHFLWFFSERAGRTAQRATQGFSEKANLGLGFIYLGYRFGIGFKTIEPALNAQLCAVGLTTHCIHKKPAAQGTRPAAGFSVARPKVPESPSQAC